MARGEGGVRERAFYNEWDSYAADWLCALAAAGHIAPGHVDRRSIRNVRPVDLDGYERVHLFAGIGGWDLALRLAGWPAGLPVWTGSCPCQPFSAAGKRGGIADERHLWPEMFRLVAECRPPVVFGEQVASADGLAWLDLVSADLEGAGYAFGAVDLCAAGVGAPHIRQRLWWVGVLADAEQRGRQGRRVGPSASQASFAAENSLSALWLGDARGTRGGRHTGAVPSPEGEGASEWGRTGREPHEPVDAGSNSRLAYAHGGHPNAEGLQRGREHGQQPQNGGAGFWSTLEWLPCRDGKARPTRPGLFPLATGLSGRVGKLRAAGNAIVPQAGAAFIRAVMAALRPDQPGAAEGRR